MLLVPVQAHVILAQMDYTGMELAAQLAIQDVQNVVTQKFVLDVLPHTLS